MQDLDSLAYITISAAGAMIFNMLLQLLLMCIQTTMRRIYICGLLRNHMEYTKLACNLTTGRVLCMYKIVCRM